MAMSRRFVRGESVVWVFDDDGFCSNFKAEIVFSRSLVQVHFSFGTRLRGMMDVEYNRDFATVSREFHFSGSC